MTYPNTAGELKFVHSARPSISHEQVADAVRAAWQLEGRFVEHDGDRDQNLVLTTDGGARYLLKIAQPDEDPGVLDLPVAALRHIEARAPELPVPRVVPTTRGAFVHAIDTADGRHRMRLFSYLPGRPISRHRRTPALMHAVGSTLARLDRALSGFFHRDGGHALLWDIRQAKGIRPTADTIADPQLRDRVLERLDACSDDLLPRLAGLRAQIIHGDVTADNVLAGGDPAQVSGIIDFGDVVHASLAQELGIAMVDATLGLEDPWTAACALAAGYDEVTALEDGEIELLWDVARARLALTLPILAIREIHRPGDHGSPAEAMLPSLRHLDAIEAGGRDAALRQLRRVLRVPTPIPAVAPIREAANAQRDRLLERRRRSLMPGLALFYPEDPLHAVRGEGVWLIDASGRRHLDCYNNVPQVGHAHPHVVRAIARQSAALNTNTRYLYDSILEYTEALAARLPGDLGVALFVNSGSEAIDVAWQMARAFTGGDGALVTGNAYHGGTEAVAALSPYDLPTDAVPAGHVARLEMTGAAGSPDHGGFDGQGAERAIAALAERGHRPAAFIVDPSLASDGILDPTDRAFGEVVAAVRAAGGLCIADEVQSGFGRLGTWWGFESRGLVPDIVTLGKPVANGYPVGVVVTTPAIMAAFAARHDYFSTFGGNPVACMAALAVIDVIERDELCAHAAEVGAYLRQGLTDLASRHPDITAVRGRGLFVGVELAHGGTQPHAGATASTVALGLRRRGVLVGVEGPGRRVLKIRPPLVFQREHADLLVEALDDVLSTN